MYSIKYTQEGKNVCIQGFNPDNPLDTLSETMVFKNSVDAHGFCLAVDTIEAAVRSQYNGPFAVAVSDNIVDITTQTPIPIKAKAIVKQLVQMVLDVSRVAKYIQFYSLD